jgi:heterodisulfide reductase subunit A
VPYNGALPNAVVIDEENCLKFQGGECRACADACPFDNIDLEERDTVVERQAGAVILATGAEARLADENVLAPRIITAGALERVLNPSGPTGGELRLPDLDEPRSIVLVHCADEKGHAPAEACSRVCCMAFAKFAHTIVEKAPGCEVTQLLWDRCAGGKGYREFFNAATRAERVRQIRLDSGDEVTAVTDTGDGVTVSYTCEGRPAELKADVAVIAPPLGGSAAAGRLAGALRLERGERGFFIEEHEHLRSFATRREGVFAAGCAQSPKNIQESTAQGAAAAGAVLSALVPGRKLRVEPAVAAVEAEKCGACRTCVLTCPYKAVAFDEDRGVADVNGLLCRGCGTCAAACPAGAITARHFSDRQLGAETAALAIQQQSD